MRKVLLGCFIAAAHLFSCAARDTRDMSSGSAIVTTGVILVMYAHLGGAMLATNPASSYMASKSPVMPPFARCMMDQGSKTKKNDWAIRMLYPRSNFHGKHSSSTENRHTMMGHKPLQNSRVQRPKK